MIMSLDGYTEDEHGRFGWGAPEDQAVHSFPSPEVRAYGAPIPLNARATSALAG
jgi:hypothetical protein